MRLFNSRLILWGLYSLLIPEISCVPVSEDPYSENLQTSQIDDEKTPIPRHFFAKASLETRNNHIPPQGCFLRGKRKAVSEQESARFRYRIYDAGEAYAEVDLRNKIGSGHEGDVWDGTLTYLDTEDNRKRRIRPNVPKRVAVKISDDGHVLDQSNLEQRIDSSYILKYIERFWSITDGKAVLVMPKGKMDLRKALERNWRGLSLLVTILGAGMALFDAKKARIVHRDVKLANILLMANGDPYLIDWGLAKYMGRESTLPAGKAPGTDNFMGPEAYHGEEHDPYSNDVWSLNKTWLKAEDNRVKFNKDYENWVDNALRPPRQKDGTPSGLSHDDASKFMKDNFPDLGEDKRRLMAAGLCRQDERWNIDKWLDDFINTFEP
ncbi:hypothetical protein NUU61_000770 [Penicillium alfredii]|uniref:non-specific serine/threonine protein kinase n=1 Tax=Penicillium alfredii TaxID=1506179 RepID=A0A9W9GAD7_9EURO|nr:uncharacterized protein NUU61_000770 [Penicillium alfredii]KAJ5115011.1 hypothetical protein NUU61_000770 [Penicillium alfredii]